MTVDKIIDDVLLYLIWLQTPIDNFNDMPVCPFIKKDLDNDEILFLVQKKNNEFIDLIKKWDVRSVDDDRRPPCPRQQ